jgi:hypothetical protein
MRQHPKAPRCELLGRQVFDCSLIDASYQKRMAWNMQPAKNVPDSF